jgi:hypothetical protein
MTSASSVEKVYRSKATFQLPILLSIKESTVESEVKEAPIMGD